MSFYNEIREMDKNQLNALIDFMESHDGYHLDELQSQIYKIYDEFISVYQYLIPALIFQYCDKEKINLDTEGSTTSTFDSVKQFYLDVYESLGILMVVPVALNNIKYRHNMDSMYPIETGIGSLKDYIEQTKARRYRFCLDEEIYTKSLKVLYNSKLRNAIGHNDVEYDSISQEITYIPNPKDRTKSEREYLLEFENEAVHMFQGILGISEYLYKLKQLSLIRNGIVPISQSKNPIKSNKKIGRNDPCHGKN